MNDQLSAKDWLDQGLKTLAKDGFTALKAEPLAKAMRGVARQLLLAFCRYRRVPCRDPRALARGRRRADHRQCRGGFERRKPARAAAAPGVQRTADAGAGGPHLGERRSRGPRRRAGHRPAPAELCRKPSDAVRIVRGQWPVPAPKFSIGRFLALRYRISHCRKRANRPCSTNCCGSLRHDTLRSNMLRTAAS